jgi:hypothetical protein
MNLPIRIGMDTFKSVFQLHGVDGKRGGGVSAASFGEPRRSATSSGFRRLRERLVSVESQLSNAFRSYAAEFGIVGPRSQKRVRATPKISSTVPNSRVTVIGCSLMPSSPK